MRRKVILAIVLLILLTTINSQNKISISKFYLNNLIIENNSLLSDQEIRKSLSSIYGKNLIFLKNEEIEKSLMQIDLIESFNVKKKYPDTIKIKIFEKKPIAILQDKKEKFYLSDKIDLIEFNNNSDFKNLPYVLGDQENFKIFYENLKKINFPFHTINKYVFFESNRWDLETLEKKIIKLPSDRYLDKLEKYLDIKDKNNFKKYKTFDFRIKDQLILK